MLDSSPVACSVPRSALSWPVAGVVLAAAVWFSPPDLAISMTAGLGVWGAVMVLLLALSANPLGARVGATIAGLALAVPSLVWNSAIERFTLLVLMSVALASGVALMFSPHGAGPRERLRFLCTWGGSRPVGRRPFVFDWAAARNLTLATAILGLAILTIQAGGIQQFGYLPRWVAGVCAALAIGEMMSASMNLFAGVLGVGVPPWFRSPHLSTSVGEFWGRRWNLAATGMVLRPCFFAPLARVSPGLALIATFAGSAIGHFLLIYATLGRLGPSVSCGVFFLVQPLFMLAERRMGVRRWPTALQRAWTAAAIGVASPLIIEPTLQMANLDDGGAGVLLPVSGVFAFVVLFCLLVALASRLSCGSRGSALRPAD